MPGILFVFLSLVQTADTRLRSASLDDWTAAQAMATMQKTLRSNKIQQKVRGKKYVLSLGPTPFLNSQNASPRAVTAMALSLCRPRWLTAAVSSNAMRDSSAHMLVCWSGRDAQATIGARNTAVWLGRKT